MRRISVGLALVLALLTAGQAEAGSRIRSRLRAHRTATVPAVTLGAWGPFNSSRYIATAENADPFDAAAATNNFTFCAALELASADNGGYWFEARYNGNISDWTGRTLRSSATIVDAWIGNYTKPRINQSYSTTETTLCFGESGAGHMRIALYGVLGSYQTGAYDLIGDTGRPTYIGCLRALGAGDSNCSKTKIKAIAIFLSAPTDELLTAKLADGLDGRFEPDASASLICNGSEIGGECATGGKAFSLIGAVPFTPAAQ